MRILLLRLSLVVLLPYGVALPAFSQNSSPEMPLAIEDSRMDAYLASRRPATLTVKLLNAPPDLGVVNVKGSFVGFGAEFQVERHYQIGPEREITLTLEDNLPYQQIWLHVGKYLYAGVYVNSDLTVAVDLDKAKGGAYMIGEGIRYSGTDGELNRVMNEHVLFRRDERYALRKKLDSLRRQNEELPDSTLWARADSIRGQLRKINSEFLARHPRYGWAVTNEVNSEFYGQMCLIHWGRKMPEIRAREIGQHKPFFTSNNGVQYYDYLGVYLMNRNPARFSLKGRADLFDRLCQGPKADILTLGLLEMSKKVTGGIDSAVLAVTETRWCRAVIEKELEETLATLQRAQALLASGDKVANPEAAFGKPLSTLPFGASLYRLDSLDNAEDFLSAIRSRFRDKAVIIDFWATWCGPCIASMPYGKKLHEENKDLPVEYLYLCTSSSSNEGLWKSKVAELGLPGTHIFVEDKLIAGLKKLLDAKSGYPAYVILDSRGRLHPTRINWISEVNRKMLESLVSAPEN